MILDIVVLVTTDIWNKDVKLEAEKIKSPDIQVRVTDVSIESEYDEVFASPYVVSLAEELELNGSNGIIIYCFGEPGLHACKEKLNIPVVGLREAAVSMARILGDRIGVISTIKSAVPRHGRALKHEVHKVVAVDMPVLDFVNVCELEKRIEIKIQELIKCGCDVVVLGCGPMLNMDINRMQNTYGVPIVIPLNAAIGVCEFLMKNNLKQSKQAYPFPPVKEMKRAFA
jgi:allantoin racemase